MSKMKINLTRSYKSKNGNVVFVYSVSGKPEQLEAFKEAQGEYYREDEKTGSPLWFTTRCVGKTGNLVITTNGKVVPDMSEFDQAASLAAQYGGNLGAEIARVVAEKMFDKDKTTKSFEAKPESEDEDISKL